MTSFGDIVLSAEVNIEKFTEEYVKYNAAQGRVTPEQILFAFGCEIKNLKKKREDFSRIVTTIANADERAKMENRIVETERVAAEFLEFARLQGNVFMGNIENVTKENFLALYQGSLERWQEQDRRDRSIENQFGQQQKI